MAARVVVALPTAVALAVALAVAPGLAGPSVIAAGAARPSGHVTLEGNGLGPVHLGTPQAEATRELSTRLGTPSGRQPSGCVGYDPNVVWHDLIVQFKNGRLSGYRYWVSRPHQAVAPRLATAKGITLGSTFGELRRAYRLAQTGTDFWSAGALTFGLGGAAYPSPPNAPVAEIKVAACPAAL